jgi:hypothetical protein
VEESVNWGTVTVSMMAVFGAASVALTQISTLITKAIDVVRVWRELRREIRKR